ncbi:MAG: putative toxin-antitoxin system toxin component, PIN family [Saprospiraceae bacterium]|nr:putative toxin-antitoxin system toxin component, PIN family [Saprospiraceae bacterium]
MANQLRIILDTNWYVSATINRTSRRRLFSLLTNPKLTIVYSSDLIKEYEKVMARDKFKKYVRPNQIKRFIELVLTRLVEFEVKSIKEGSRDISDNYLLGLSVDSNADYLVTGDPDLLVLGNIEGTIILNMADFLIRLQDIEQK